MELLEPKIVHKYKVDHYSLKGNEQISIIAFVIVQSSLLVAPKKIVGYLRH